ncbi:helix-turn-helix domain-containing protein [Nocardia rhizosphaerihabitans]|uniref:helix-turn-helix domain-containing protein n=1 Tax=Nocardia rhizosphaerihabitans TaxID=1691570 RepID=UPI00366C8C4C
MDISPVWAVPRGTEGVRIMVQAGVAHGVSAADCLIGTGLTERDLDNEEAEIWAHQEFQVIRNLIARLGDRPGSGADVGEFSTLGRTGVIGFMMLAGPTFLAAVERAIPYLALSPTHLRFAIDVDADYAYLIASGSELPADVRTFIIERDLAGLAAALRGAHIDLAPVSIDTTLEPARAAMLGQAWGITPDHIRANQDENQLVIPRSILDLRLPQADTNTARIFERQCRRILDHRLARVGVTGQVRSRLLHDPDQWPSMNTVAAELHIDSRTLRRALTKEGTSYRALLDEVRHKRAIDMLTLGRRVDEIARQLGYAETANFTHAFKRWEGLAPSHFRNLRGKSAQG